MKTIVEVDDDLITQAQQLTGIQDMEEIVEKAFRLLIQVNGQSQVRKLRGQLSWEDNLNRLREN